jgi:hypothetical protein
VPFQRQRGSEISAALVISLLVQAVFSFVGERARWIAFGVAFVVLMVLFEYSYEIDEVLFLRRHRRQMGELARIALGGQDVEGGRRMARKLMRGSRLTLPDPSELKRAVEEPGPLQADCLRVAVSRAIPFPVDVDRLALTGLQPGEAGRILHWSEQQGAPVMRLVPRLLAAAPRQDLPDMLHGLLLRAPTEPAPEWIALFRPVRAELETVRGRAPLVDQQLARYLPLIE